MLICYLSLYMITLSPHVADILHSLQGDQLNKNIIILSQRNVLKCFWFTSPCIKSTSKAITDEWCGAPTPTLAPKNFWYESVESPLVIPTERYIHFCINSHLWVKIGVMLPMLMFKCIIKVEISNTYLAWSDNGHGLHWLNIMSPTISLVKKGFR